MRAQCSRREAAVLCFRGSSGKGGPRWLLGRDGMETEPPVVAEDKTGTERSNYFHRVARSPQAAEAEARQSSRGHTIICCPLRRSSLWSPQPVVPPARGPHLGLLPAGPPRQLWTLRTLSLAGSPGCLLPGLGSANARW